MIDVERAFEAWYASLEHPQQFSRRSLWRR